MRKLIVNGCEVVADPDPMIVRAQQQEYWRSKEYAYGCPICWVGYPCAEEGGRCGAGCEAESSLIRVE